MDNNFPELKIIRLDKLVVIEHYDTQRTAPLIDRLRSSGVLRNPPIVSPFNDQSGRYMVLDGTNRTTALTKMGYPHVIVQVVEPDSPNLKLQTWNHVLWGYPTDDFNENILKISDISLKSHKGNLDLEKMWQANSLCLIQTSDSQSVQVRIPDPEIIIKVRKLNEIVSSYKNIAKFDRTKQTDIDSLSNMYDDFTGLIIFPPFNIDEIMDLCGEGHLFPPGITRFSITPRALRINYPLDDLAADRSLNEKNEQLKLWVQERIARKGVRFYSEATVLFDE